MVTASQGDAKIVKEMYGQALQSLFGRNILNNRAVTGALFVLGISYVSQRLRKPATFGLTVTVRFGP